MAKFTPILGQISGKIGGLVFTRNRYGPMIRSRGVPVNPHTPRRSTSSARLSAASAFYRAYISRLGEQAPWIEFAKNFAYRTMRDGTTPLFLTGQAFSVGVNAVRMEMDLPPTLQPPDDWGAVPSDPAQVAYSAEAICVPGTQLICRLAPVPFNLTRCGALIRATAPLPLGIANPNVSDFRVLRNPHKSHREEHSNPCRPSAWCHRD